MTPPKLGALALILAGTGLSSCTTMGGNIKGNFNVSRVLILRSDMGNIDANVTVVAPVHPPPPPHNGSEPHHPGHGRSSHDDEDTEVSEALDFEDWEEEMMVETRRARSQRRTYPERVPQPVRELVLMQPRWGNCVNVAVTQGALAKPRDPGLLDATPLG